MHRHVVWFSCGAASAVAAKLMVDDLGTDPEVLEIVYCDTMSTEHEDNARFMRDVEAWIGRPVTLIKSDKYSDIDDVFQRARYMAGIGGAKCTTVMKKAPRIKWQRPADIHVFGYTADERKRAESFEDRNPSLDVEWPLIDRGITKDDCLSRLVRAGIDLPIMYSLGFAHNNCLGCVKATSPGYWNRTRRHFPEVFARRARQSDIIGAKLVRVRGVRIPLSELEPGEGLAEPDGDIECGPVCQLSLEY